MKETITQIQDLIFQSDLPEDEKKQYIGRFEAMKDIDFAKAGFNSIEKLLEKLLEQAKDNISVVKTFFTGMDEIIKNVLEKGKDGFDEEMSKLEKKE